MSKTVFLFSLLCCLTKAEYSVRCNNSSRSDLTFEPSADGVEGRYTVDWCTTADRNVTDWELVMRYDDTRAPEQCREYNIRTHPGRVHSRFDRLVEVDLNCTNVCFSTNLDLVFNGTCYHIKSWLRRGTKSSAPHDSVHYIINQSTKEHFTLSEARFAHFNKDEDFVVHWYFGYVPVTEFKVELCTDDFQCTDVCDNCTVTGPERAEVRCELRAPLGCYSVRLHQRAPWSVALSLFPRHVHLQQRVCNRRAPPVPAPPQPQPPWAAVAAVSVAVLAVLLLLGLKRVRLEALRLRVLRDWRDRPVDPAGKPLTESEEKRRILLLYARDCPPFATLAALLRQLLAEGTGCQVIDLYSAETVRAAAAAPSEWLQAALDGARVVLLQSPAAHALYAPAAPLRGAVVRAAPHSSDWLLALALRRLAESGHAGLPYRRYFVVEVAGLEAEVLPHLTQLRRYSLPTAAELLLRDMALPQQQQEQQLQQQQQQPQQQQQQQQQQQLVERLQQLSAAVEELHRYVRDNPDYIVDLFQVC